MLDVQISDVQITNVQISDEKKKKMPFCSQRGILFYLLSYPNHLHICTFVICTSKTRI
ncbi:hypothetical protein SAMN05216464_109136 [Mucilaginibacter pineti]|uniref:Uncharacterized protein n=1 Tax=Mucilaginibacter pineti TaxID=1391627 RepID=A0A1G7FN09_9SPHI|nr:hypothetical protein SAMN05216464_109136 [Mucilaginibacter pineti]